MARGVQYRLTDPYGTEGKPMFEVIAEGTSDGKSIDWDTPVGYSHAERLLSLAH